MKKTSFVLSTLTVVVWFAADVEGGPPHIERKWNAGTSFWEGQRGSSSSYRTNQQYGGYSYQPQSSEVIRSYSYQPRPSDVVRSFSYEPAAFKAGDKVVVSANETKLMRGKETMGVLKNGHKFTVLKVEGPWLGARIEVNGKMIGGWIWNRHVTRESNMAGAARTSDGAGVVDQPRVKRHWFS